MECINGGLKSSLTSPEMNKQQGVWDDLSSSLVAQNATVSAEDFFVDDLLDFSQAQVEDDEKMDKIEDDTVYLSSLKLKKFDTLPVAVHENEFCIPADELAELEWLSYFVDDSTPGYSLTIPPAEKLAVKSAGTEQFSFPAKAARSRRAKPGVRVWPLSDSSTSSSSSSHTSSLGMCNDVTQSAESFTEKPPAKKQKAADTTATTGGVQPRRCSHCLVQKTPQWRAGPQGAKTLCNACGVRFKSGRLLPEYRPACSPTFSIKKHSNNHRKVLEMRRKKDGFATAVESF